MRPVRVNGIVSLAVMLLAIRFKWCKSVEIGIMRSFCSVRFLNTCREYRASSLNSAGSDTCRVGVCSKLLNQLSRVIHCKTRVL